MTRRVANAEGIAVRTTAELGLVSSLNPPGRPPKRARADSEAGGLFGARTSQRVPIPVRPDSWPFQQDGLHLAGPDPHALASCRLVPYLTQGQGGILSIQSTRRVQYGVT